MPRRQAHRLDCPGCGYVPGATAGYPKLKPEERQALLDMGYEIDENVHGDEIARELRIPHQPFNSARYELHRVICRPTRFDRI